MKEQEQLDKITNLRIDAITYALRPKKFIIVKLRKNGTLRLNGKRYSLIKEKGKDE